MTSNNLLRAGLLSAVVALMLPTQRVSAQEMDHSKMHMPMSMPMPEEKKAPEKKPAAKKKPPKPAAPAMQQMDHSKMHMPMPAGTSTPAKKPARKKPVKAKSKAAPAMDHSGMGHDMPMPANPAPEPMDTPPYGAYTVPNQRDVPLPDEPLSTLQAIVLSILVDPVPCVSQ